MKRRPLRSNLNSPKTKKSKQRQAKVYNDNNPRETVESQVLAWDGILAAMTFAVPFVVVVSINLQAGIAITAALAVVLVPVSLLNYSLREKLHLPVWLVAPFCALASAGITAFVAVYIRNSYAQVNDALGMYLYLLCAYPVVGAVFYGKKSRTLGLTVSWALRNIIYFGIFTCIAGLVRELLAYNRFAGIDLDMSFKIEAAKMPFFGFIVFAFVLAGVASVYRLASGRIFATGTSEEEEYSGIEIDMAQQMVHLVARDIPGPIAPAVEGNADD